MRGTVGQWHAGIARSAHRILLWAGLAVLLTGIPQFMTNATRYYTSPVFNFKMALLAVALVYTATVRRWVAVAEGDRLPSWKPRAVGAVSIVLWTTLTIVSRWIGFSG